MDCPSYIFASFQGKEKEKEKVIFNKKVNWFIGDSNEIFSLKKIINKEYNK